MSDRDDDDDVDEVPKKKMKVNDVLSYFENEAEESGDEEDMENEDQGEEEVNMKDDYVRDGFVVDEDEDESNDDEQINLKSTKKDFKRLTKKREFRLEEEDLDLIAENTVLTRQDSEIVPERVDRSKISSYPGSVMFDDDEEERAVPRIQEAEEEDDYDSDDMDDFLEDDIGDDRRDDMDGDEEIPERSSRKTSRKKSMFDYGPSRAQLDEAVDIFGDGFEDIMDGNEEEDLYDEPGTAIDINKMNSIRAQYERNVLVESFCTERDDYLRKTDRPERYLDVMVGRVTPDDIERSEEAEWIAKKFNFHSLVSMAVTSDLTEDEIRVAWLPHIIDILRFVQVSFTSFHFLL